MSEKEFLKKKKASYTRGRKLCLFLFAAATAFFAVLGLMLPIRPTESDVEKRTLAKFPEFTVSGALDGTYFSDISTWYSDSFPLRDTWMSGNNLVKGAYGLRTKQVVSTGNTSDEIPTVPAKTDDTDSSAQTVSQAEQTTAASADAQAAVAEVTTLAAETTASSASADTTSAAAAANTDDSAESSGTLAQITGQTSNGEYIEGDTAYGMYFFNLEAANTYITMVNRVADELAGKSTVYTLLVPLSEAYYLTDEERKALDPEWANELEAMNYYVGSFNSNVVNVPVYETLAQHTDEYIYFRTDHHWTALGAYYSYAAWAGVKGIEANALESYTAHDYGSFLGEYYATNPNSAMEANPDTLYAYDPLTYNRMVFQESDGTTLEWPIVNDVSNYRTSQKYSCFAAGDNPFSHIENPNVTNGQSCVLIKESYADAFIPYLTDHYQYIYWFDYRYYSGNIMNFILEHNINDIIFVNGMDPITSIESMQRLNSLLP